MSPARRVGRRIWRWPSPNPTRARARGRAGRQAGCRRCRASAHLSWEDGPLADPDLAGTLAPPAVDEETGLADHLSAARESADICKAADGRSRIALYRALGDGL